MSQKKSNICPNCKEHTSEDVCSTCGHIMDDTLIRQAEISADKNVTPNKFLIALYTFGIVLFFAASIAPVKAMVNNQKEIASKVPTLAGAVITFLPLLIFLFLVIRQYTRLALVLNNGTCVVGTVYGYTDDLYEGDKGTREEVCYVRYTENDSEYLIKIPFNLYNSKSLTFDDRPYAPEKKLKIKIYKDLFYILE